MVPQVSGAADGTPPYAFSEQGVTMLSSVLNSPRAVAIRQLMKPEAGDKEKIGFKIEEESARILSRRGLMSDSVKREWRFYLDDMIDFTHKVLTMSPPCYLS